MGTTSDERSRETLERIAIGTAKIRAEYNFVERMFRESSEYKDYLREKNEIENMTNEKLENYIKKKGL